eukprot:6461599-Amphidinium_carterae.1
MVPFSFETLVAIVVAMNSACLLRSRSMTPTTEASISNCDKSWSVNESYFQKERALQQVPLNIATAGLTVYLSDMIVAAVLAFALLKGSIFSHCLSMASEQDTHKVSFCKSACMSYTRGR